MHHNHPAMYFRYSKSSKELLVGYINAKNNRNFKVDDIVFGTPTLVDASGLSAVSVAMSPLTGLSTTPSELTYYRQLLSDLLQDKPITIHVAEQTNEAIFAAILEQYGILLEPDLVTLDLISADPNPVPALDNASYMLTFNDNHLIFFGQVRINTRRTITSLGLTIDSLMDLREFYKDGNFNLPKVELLIPNGELYLGSDVIANWDDRRPYEEMLYGVTTGTFLTSSSQVPSLMERFTGDVWISEDHPADFNLYGARVLYNGFVSADFDLKDKAYNYILVIDLDPMFCTNLTGLLKIGYRYSSDAVPGNLSVDYSYPQPLFSR